MCQILEFSISNRILECQHQRLQICSNKAGWKKTSQCVPGPVSWGGTDYISAEV